MFARLGAHGSRFIACRRQPDVHRLLGPDRFPLRPLKVIVDIVPAAAASASRAYHKHSYASVSPTAAMSADSLTLPARPTPIVAQSSTLPEATIAAIKAELDSDSARRSTLFDLNKPLASHSQHALHALHCGDMAAAQAALEAARPIATKVIEAIEGAPSPWQLRSMGNIAMSFENLISAQCLSTFFETGKLAPRASFAEFNDEEYLKGSIAFCQTLGRYAVGRATFGDVASVVICRDLVQEVNGKLIEFDFRNGPLRRKYDGVKYALKRLEDVLYELSLTGKTAVVDGEQPSKRLKTSATADGDAGAEAAADQDTMIMAADFDAIRATMDTYDKRREAVIKSTRDVQKLSKQAIFSLQRGQAAKATTQLVDAVKISKAIFEEHIKVEPPLRQGSYSNAMEEFAEAVLFKVWLDDQRICALDAPEFEGLIDSTEYLGGLVDFTGEVGRFAVAAATKRNDEKVRLSLAADLAVQDVFMKLGLPSKLSKKESALRTNVKKLEHIMYELSLVKASGRKVTATKTEESSGGAKDDE